MNKQEGTMFDVFAMLHHFFGSIGIDNPSSNEVKITFRTLGDATLFKVALEKELGPYFLLDQ